MASYFGKHIHVSVFGQSHAPAIGVTVDGLPAGEAVDLEELQRFLQRRAPGRDATSTPRKEGDVPQDLVRPGGRESPAELRWPPSSRTPTPAPKTTTSSGTSPGPPTPTSPPR